MCKGTRDARDPPCRDPGCVARGSGVRGQRVQAAVRVAGHAVRVKGRAAPGLLLQERRISDPRSGPLSRVASFSAGLSCALRLR